MREKVREIIREILEKSNIFEISAKEKEDAYAKSSKRTGFSEALMKQAIEQGREIGLNFRSNNEKYTMPTTKSRIVHPVVMGRSSNGKLMIRGLHITGQSEKEAIRTGVRSAEINSETDGIGAWRLFNSENIKSMWFTERFFNDNKPGYTPSDRAFSSISSVYSPTNAKRYQDSIGIQAPQADIENNIDTQPTVDNVPVKTEPSLPKTNQAIKPIQAPKVPLEKNIFKRNKDKSFDQIGYEK